MEVQKVEEEITMKRLMRHFTEIMRLYETVDLDKDHANYDE